MPLATFVFAYFFGGVTLLPLLVFTFVYLHPKKQPEIPAEPLLAGEIEEHAQTGLDCFKQGWIFVTHEDLESQDEISSKTESVAESQDVKSAYSSLYKLVTNSGKNSVAGNSENSANTNSESSISSGPVHVDSGTVGPSSGPVSPPPKANSATKKHRYYAVLKHGNLFLYKNEKLQDVKHVIVLSNHVVSLWPRSLSEASLFTKYSSIAILKNDWSRTRRLSDNFAGNSWDGDQKISIQDVLRKDSGLPAPPGTIFVYTDLNIEKEDWYFALIRATKTDTPGPAALDPSVYAKTMHLETQSMISLIQNLYGSEGQLQSKWFNAILGRIFLSLQKTDFMINYLTSKIERKLNKIKTPGFLDKFQIIKVDAGKAAPTVTFPVLKEINPEGDLLVSFNVQYTGEMAIQLATKVNINLGSRFKTREVDVLLSVTLEKISGPMLVRLKAPPSSRIWYTYEREPDVSIKIEPVISSRQMSYNIITNTIEKKFKDAIKESLVLPHWDDLVFCHNPDELYRGGIWDKDARKEEEDQEIPAKEAPDTSDLLSVDTASVTTDISEERKLDAVGLVDAAPTKKQKVKVSKTISDISRRLRKPKSTHTLGVDETHCLSDGSVVEASRRSPVSTSFDEEVLSSPRHNDEAHNVSTLRKLGEWYSRSDKASTKSKAAPSPTEPTYHPPEMITNRRTRKQSSATVNSDVEKASSGSSYDFGQELSDSVRISHAIDLTSPAIVKASPPELPPRELKAASVVGAVTELTAGVDAHSSGVSSNEIVSSRSADDVSSIEKMGQVDQLSNDSVTLSSGSQRSLSRSNTTIGRKPPPDSSEDHMRLPTISTAPL